MKPNFHSDPFLFAAACNKNISGQNPVILTRYEKDDSIHYDKELESTSFIQASQPFNSVNHATIFNQSSNPRSPKDTHMLNTCQIILVPTIIAFSPAIITPFRSNVMPDESRKKPINKSCSMTHPLINYGVSLQSRKIKKANTCGHSDKPHYAKNLCSNCYHKYGRTKKPWKCNHDKLYAHGYCQNCYAHCYNTHRDTDENIETKIESKDDVKEEYIEEKG